MANKKKLKDLRKGDRVWDYLILDTTPIYVVSAKREKDIMRIIVKWDNSEYECVGMALGTIFIAYTKRWQVDLIFTTDYEGLKYRETEKNRKNADAKIGENIRSLFRNLKSLNL